MLVEKLRKIRKDKHITLKQMSEMTGTTYTSISDIENGKANPTLDTLNRLADALDCKIIVVENK